MAENALPEMVVKDENQPTAESSDPKQFPISTSSATEVSDKDEMPEKPPSNPDAQKIMHSVSETFSQTVASLRSLKLPPTLPERFSRLTANLGQIGKQILESPITEVCIRCVDAFVDTSGLVVRRLQRVVQSDTGCLNTCPYLQHYHTCPFARKSSCCSSESGDIFEKDSKEATTEVLSKKASECEDQKPEISASEVDPKLANSEVEDVPKQMSAEIPVPPGSLETLFYFSFTWFVLYPVNAVVALLNFLRSLTHDLHDYYHLPSTYVTAVGGRIVSPRQAIRSRLLNRVKTLLNEMISLSAGDHTMPLKLSLDSQMSTLWVEPVYETRQLTPKREFSLADIADSLISDDDYPDHNYQPKTPSGSSSSAEYEDSITVSESDLSVQEEGGFLALKEKAKVVLGSENPTLPVQPETAQLKTEVKS